jgi:hypothetical protein
MARILFIGIRYYSYTDRIIEEMRAQGHLVDYHAIERVDPLSKTFKRYGPAGYARSLSAYHRRLIEAAGATRYDFVLLLQAHHFTRANLQALRQSQPQARFLLYNWDSLTTHDYSPHLDLFEASATFDPDDAARLGIHYLPLFALPEYFDVARSTDAAVYDLYFVGSVHSMARYEAVRRLSEYCRANRLRLKLYLHCSPPRFLGLLGRGKLMKGMTLRSVGTEAIVAMMQASRAVFDFSNHRQSGYTMRLVENMCAGKKVVTANQHIAGEPFFSEDRFLVLGSDLDFSGLKAFIDRPLANERDFSSFSLASWTSRLLSL